MGTKRYRLHENSYFKKPYKIKMKKEPQKKKSLLQKLKTSKSTCRQKLINQISLCTDKIVPLIPCMAIVFIT